MTEATRGPEEVSEGGRTAAATTVTLEVIGARDAHADVLARQERSGGRCDAADDAEVDAELREVVVMARSGKDVPQVTCRRSGRWWW